MASPVGHWALVSQSGQLVSMGPVIVPDPIPVYLSATWHSVLLAGVLVVVGLVICRRFHRGPIVTR